ncbi:MAG: thioredoxin [Fidelibacterota bacterium]
MLEFTDSNFEQEVLQADLPVLVDFWAAWCMPCLKIAPIVEELEEKYKGRMKFGKVNVEDNPMFPQNYGIRSIPTLLIFKDGKVYSQIVGAVPRHKLEENIQAAL